MGWDWMLIRHLDIEMGPGARYDPTSERYRDPSKMQLMKTISKAGSLEGFLWLAKKPGQPADRLQSIAIWVCVKTYYYQC